MIVCFLELKAYFYAHIEHLNLNQAFQMKIKKVCFNINYRPCQIRKSSFIKFFAISVKMQ